KAVTNNNGGSAQPNDFKPSVGGNVVSSGAKNTYQANTPLAIDETQVAGYQFVGITGNAKCPAALGSTITLALGDDITCTISNDDIPAHLIIITVVNNTQDGTKVASDFSNTITGVTAQGGNASTGTLAS